MGNRTELLAELRNVIDLANEAIDGKRELYKYEEAHRIQKSEDVTEILASLDREDEGAQKLLTEVEQLLAENERLREEAVLDARARVALRQHLQDAEAELEIVRSQLAELRKAAVNVDNALTGGSCGSTLEDLIGVYESQAIRNLRAALAASDTDKGEE